MAPKRKPTIRAVWLGQELRKMRDEAGLTVREIGSLLQFNQSNVSKLENGVYPASREHVESYIRVCGVEDPKQQSDVLTICRDVLRKGWWDGYSRELAAELMDRIWLESKAVHIDSFEPILIPGLLQTTAYALAVMRTHQPSATDEELERWLEVRATRQLIIIRQEPITFRAIVDEAAIKRTMVDKETGATQLAYLAQAAQRPNLELRILPQSSGLHASMSGSFEVLKLKEPYPEAGLLNTPSGEVCVEGETVEDLNHRYDQLLELSLSPEASRDYILAEVDKQ